MPSNQERHGIALGAACGVPAKILELTPGLATSETLITNVRRPIGLRVRVRAREQAVV